MSSFSNSNNLGALSSNLPNHDINKKFYITTAIAYTNGYPHIGHAYEFLSTDAIARYHRVLGYDTFFLTGSDEHGQKVAASAEKAGRTPIEHCDHFVTAFKELNRRLLVSNNDYLRTTSPIHEEYAQRLWKMCGDNGDIYLAQYEGYYNEREETFVTDTEAEAQNFIDPGTGLPLKRVTEESYFFRMSLYCDKLIQYIEENPTFIEPEQYRNNILSRLRKEGLKDLSLSRTSFSWGIPVPEGYDKRHVMYVWFDALTNYITGIRALDVGDERNHYWPADRHVIGKDIIWFHCVIWPCMLLSAGVPLPKGVYAHGFVNGPDGRKMSKSYNNIVEPIEMLNKYPTDTLRYFFCSSVTYGADIDFLESNLVQMHNSELADILGNLVNRAMNLCSKYCNSEIPDTQHDASFGLPFDVKDLIDGVTQDMAACSINLAIGKAMDAARSTNKYLTNAEPWKMKGADESRRPAIVRTTLEAIYVFTHFLAPVLPQSADDIFKKLNTDPVVADRLDTHFYNLKPGTVVSLGDILFKKIEMKREDRPVEKKAVVEVVVEDPNQDPFTKMELRVGRIVSVWDHETADRLYVEKIDVGKGEGALLCVVSNLRGHYSLEELENRKVVVVCNLKESKIQGVMSMAMVLAGKGGEGDGLGLVKLVEPPVDAVVGERVFIEGLDGPALPAARIKKLKVWEAVSPDLKSDDGGVVCWQGRPLKTSTGTIQVPLMNVTIS